MATQETRNERNLADGSPETNASPVRNKQLVRTGSVMISMIVIGAFVSFVVALVGFMTDRYAVLVAGSFGLASVAFIWAVAASIALLKIAKDWLVTLPVLRRLVRPE